MATRLGIRQPQVTKVTGTVVMMADEKELALQASNLAPNALKYTAGGIILDPQPHVNPNDPLNWSMLRRDVCMALIGIQSFLGGGQSPILAAGMLQLLKEFHKPLSTISYLVGGFMLALGLGSVFASPTAKLFGKRFVYLLGILVFLAGSLWAGGSSNFGNLMGARVVMGFGTSPTESLPSATIAEIYFAHERAYRVGIYTMLMLGGKNIVPLLSGLVFQYLDRHWLFWILSMFLGANLILTFLFVPETFWDRTPIPNKRSKQESEAAIRAPGYRPPTERPNAFAWEYGYDNELVFSRDDEIPEKKSYYQELSIYAGRYTKESWWMVALRPFLLYSYPGVLFSSFTYAFAVVWLIMVSETVTSIFGSQAYGYKQNTIGLFYISPFVGGILGSLTCGLVSDRMTRYMVSRNHGIYEPEYRLLMIFPATFFIVLGLMGYGWSSYNEDLWIGPVIFFGCLSFGSSIASTTAITFAVDSYKMFAAEVLVCLSFLKNLMGFIFSLFNSDFISSRGNRTTFITYGAVQLFISLFAIPLYIYGKKVRAWTDSKQLMRFLYNPDS